MKKSKNTAKMEVMEEGNLMDRIPILLTRDIEYYEVRAADNRQTNNN